MTPRLLTDLPRGRPALLVHGGAWALPPEDGPAHRTGVMRAAEAGWAVLARGGSALEAVVTAVRVLEEDPLFDAGVGSFLNREGEVELDAACMEGTGLRLGAVAAVRRVASPVLLARKLLEGGEASFLVGAGAEAFAQEAGETLVAPAHFVVPREAERYRSWRAGRAGAPLSAPFGDTVGAAAVCAAGHVAVATSTGGTPFKRPGRVGDTPVVGAGFLADDALGACAATGHGESILRVQLCAAALAALPEAGPCGAVAGALARLAERVQGRAGLILVTPKGELAAGWNTPAMPCAWRAAGMKAAVGTF